MSTEVKRSNLHPHSKTVSKIAPLQTSKMQNTPTEKEDQMLKDSKKKELVSCAQNQDAKKVIKENKCKSNTKSNMCFCSPTTHQGSFRCRLHRFNAPMKSSATQKTNGRCSKFAHDEFKPRLPKFGSYDSLIQLARLGSS